VSSNTSADALSREGNVASFRMHVSRTTLKIRFGATQGARGAPGFHELDRFSFAQSSATVFPVGASQCRR
jgi:hypothetical protein